MTAKPKDCAVAHDIKMKVMANTESPNIPYASQGLQTNRSFVYKPPSNLSQSFDNTLNKRVRLNPFLVSLDTLEGLDEDPDVHHVAVEVDEDKYQSRTIVFEPPSKEKPSKLKHVHVPAVSTPTFVPSITAHLVQPSDVVEDKKVRKSYLCYSVFHCYVLLLYLYTVHVYLCTRVQYIIPSLIHCYVFGFVYAHVSL